MWSLLAQLSAWPRVLGGHAGVAKRIHWFIDDASGMADPDNRRFVLANADIVDGIRPCCGFGTVVGSSNGTVRLDIRDEEPARKQARAATDRFYEGMRGRGKSIIPTISGGSFPRGAVSRRQGRRATRQVRQDTDRATAARAVARRHQRRRSRCGPLTG